MSTLNTDNIVYGLGNGQGFQQLQIKVNNTSFPFHQGDLLFLNAGIAKPVTADADAATLLGVALAPSAPSSSLDNSSAPAVRTANVGFGVKALFKTTASETYADGTLLYVGADAQTVTTVAPMSGHAVGVVSLPSDVTSVTGAAGVSVPMIVYCRSLVAYHE